MRVPEKYYDEIFDFNGKWDVPSRCGLKIIRGERQKVIVTELYQDNPGTSVTNAGKILADQICAAKSLNLNEIVYIECGPDTNSKLSFYDEEFFQVDFSGERPAYRRLDAREVKGLFPERLD